MREFLLYLVVYVLKILSVEANHSAITHIVAMDNSRSAPEELHELCSFAPSPLSLKLQREGMLAPRQQLAVRLEELHLVFRQLQESRRHWSPSKSKLFNSLRPVQRLKVLLIPVAAADHQAFTVQFVYHQVSFHEHGHGCN